MSEIRVRFSDLKIAKFLKHSVLFSGVNFFLQRAGPPEGQHLHQLDVVGMTKRQLQVDNSDRPGCALHSQPFIVAAGGCGSESDES